MKGHTMTNIEQYRPAPETPSGKRFHRVSLAHALALHLNRHKISDAHQPYALTIRTHRHRLDLHRQRRWCLVQRTTSRGAARHRGRPWPEAISHCMSSPPIETSASRRPYLSARLTNLHDSRHHSRAESVACGDGRLALLSRRSCHLGCVHAAKRTLNSVGGPCPAWRPASVSVSPSYTLTTLPS